MRGLLLPLILVILGFVGGVAAGHVFGTDKDTAVAEDGDKGHDDTDHGGEAEKAKPQADGSLEYARLNNQFVIPVVRDAAVGALVVMSVTLEVDPGGTPQVFAVEPRLRDAFLQVMFDHANAGGFDDTFTESGPMSILKRGLFEASTAILGQMVHDVLITDIVRQEV